jgi:predicted Na+-dependent transporter
MAKGHVAVSFGLMVVCVVFSAILAPPLLRSLSPLVTNAANLKIDTVKIATTLLILQLLSLIIGLWVHAKRPLLAGRLKKPANLISAGLSLLVFTLIIILQ